MNDQELSAVADIGIRVKPDYIWTMSADDAAQIQIKHGSSEADAPRGQEPVTEEDIQRVSEIIENINWDTAKKRRTGAYICFKVRSEVDGQAYTLLVQNKRKRREFGIHSMWKPKIKKPVEASVAKAPEIKRPQRSTGISEDIQQKPFNKLLRHEMFTTCPVHNFATIAQLCPVRT